MNLRCSFCQTPFTIGRIEKLDALQYLDANNLDHYDAQCPKCRRSTAVVRKRLEMTMPNWRDALKELEKEMKANPLQEAPQSTSEPVPASKAESKPSQHRTRAGKSKAEKKPAAKQKVAKKPAAKKPATKAKTATKKKK